nr:4924_t:CDS:2 [Entrophospora candida]
MLQFFIDALNLWYKQIISIDDIEIGHSFMVKCLQLAKELYDTILPKSFATSVKSLLSHKENNKGTVGNYGFSIQEAWEFFKLSLKFDFRKIIGTEPIPGELFPPLTMCHLESELISRLENFEMFPSVGCKSDLNANIIAQFLTENKEVVCYPGVVNYYFKHSVKLPWWITKHIHCYISWFKSHKERDWFHIESELQEKKCIM